MSTCKICAANGHPNIAISWKNDNGKFTPLELDKTTPHKHYNPTSTAKPIPEPNDYPNPITLPPNSNGNRNTSVSNQAQTEVKEIPKIDLNNLNVIRVLVAALQDYIAMKEAGK